MNEREETAETTLTNNWRRGYPPLFLSYHKWEKDDDEEEERFCLSFMFYICYGSNICSEEFYIETFAEDYNCDEEDYSFDSYDETTKTGWKLGGEGTIMFSDCYSLVGGNGTKYHSGYTSGARARIDTAETPGYFTNILDKTEQ